MYLSKFKNIQRLQSINRPFAVVIHMYMYYKTALLESKRAYCISRTGLDWTGLVKLGLVKRGLVKRGLVKHGLVKRGLVNKKRSTYLQKKLLFQRVYTFCVFVLSLASSMQAPCTPKGNFFTAGMTMLQT